MPLNFQPKTEEELKKSILFLDGEYDFEVTQAEETVSKTGNPMIKLTLRVFDQDGTTTSVFDYLLSAMEFKLKHFCDSVGLVAEYQAGELTADMCVSRAGRCHLKIDVDKSGKYGDKNSVKDYVPAPEEGLDDLPF